MVRLVQKLRGILSGRRSPKRNPPVETPQPNRLEEIFEKKSDLTAEPVQNIDDLRACYHILYKQYLKRGYCKPNKNKIYYNIYSLLPRSRTFAIKQKQKIIGTATLIFDTTQLLPMDTLFGKQLDALRKQGRQMAEVSMLAFERCVEDTKACGPMTHFEKNSKLFSLFKLIFEYALYAQKASDLIIGVHPRHTGIYDYLFFESLGEAREYPGVCGSLAVPMRLNFDIVTNGEKSQLKDLFLHPKTPLSYLRSGLHMSDRLIHELLIHDFDFWNDFPGHKQKYLKNFYPQLMFAA